jgi:hypothetical protein
MELLELRDWMYSSYIDMARDVSAREIAKVRLPQSLPALPCSFLRRTLTNKVYPRK